MVDAARNELKQLHLNEKSRRRFELGTIDSILKRDFVFEGDPDSDESSAKVRPVPYRSKIHQAALATYFNTLLLNNNKQTIISQQSVKENEQRMLDELDALIMSSSQSSESSSDLDL